MTPPVIVASVQHSIADFLNALILIYSLCIVAWIVLSMLFSFGMRPPYNRLSNAFFDFLRDVSEPYLGLFRRLPLRAGAFDFSPIVALLVLQIGGGLIVNLLASGR